MSFEWDKKMASAICEMQRDMKAFEKRAKRKMASETKSHLKAGIDEQLDIVERLLKKIDRDLRSCKRILNGQNSRLKKIKRLYRQYELFKPVMPEKVSPRIFKKFMDKYLVETI